MTSRAAWTGRSVVLLVVLATLLGACGSGSQAGWTFAPAVVTPAPSGSGEVSPAPSADASGAPASPSASGSPDPSASPGAANTTSTLVRTEPCPESRFECVTLAVAKDHFAPAGGDTWEVTYAIQRATGARKGTFVVITGGPGYSGIASADSYTDAYAESVTDAYDIVFLDQRGVGLSTPIGCTDAAATWYASPYRPQEPDEQASAAADAQAFVTDCLAEAQIDPADLPLYATTQAIEDLEAVRDHLGVDRLDLYGESYGTQFAQQYAAAHPEHVGALYLDGPVDLTLGAIDYYQEAARSATDTLVEVLEDCTADAACKATVKGGDALAVYDALAARLESGPITFDFPLGSGLTESRQLYATDLEYAAFDYTYSRLSREVLQRAIAAASHDDLVPLARMFYDTLAVDPDTLVPDVDPTYSDALYYAVECADYAFYPNAGDPAARLKAWVDEAETAGINDLRMATSYYGDVPCLYWPSAPTTDARPAPLPDGDYPVFVLTSTTDPATPMANGMRIYSRLDDAWFFQAIGGPHVIYAWGEACPDDQITAYLAERALPATRITTCVGEVADEYVPVAPPSASDFDDALDLMTSMDDQIVNTDDYLYRLEDDPLTVGCDFGGTILYTLTDAGTDVTMTACEFTPDVPLTGTGSIDDEAGSFELDVTIGTDSLEYERDGDGNATVKGTYDGRKVNLETDG